MLFYSCMSQRWSFSCSKFRLLAIFAFRVAAAPMKIKVECTKYTVLFNFVCFFVYAFGYEKFYPLGCSCGISQYTLFNRVVLSKKALTKSTIGFANKNLPNTFGAYFADKTRCLDRIVYCITPCE